MEGDGNPNDRLVDNFARETLMMLGCVLLVKKSGVESLGGVDERVCSSVLLRTHDLCMGIRSLGLESDLPTLFEGHTPMRVALPGRI